ncbi:MAG: GNAT family N-acetyltransferase [Pseudomonadota bacterium]
MYPQEEKEWEAVKKAWPEKFASEKTIFGHVRPGARIFIGTGCGEPQYLVQALVEYVRKHPKAFFDAEVLHVWTLGVAPYADQKFQNNFRLDSFFIGKSTREAVNRADADYTPVFLSAVPDLIRKEIIPVDIALIQTSLPDSLGYANLGISVDIVKAATDKAGLVIAQVNANMPRIHGDGFVHIQDIDFMVRHDEPLLEYYSAAPTDTADQIGRYVATIIEDGATIQVGYGSMPNAILDHLHGKKHLGLHTELLTDGAAELIRRGVVDNTRKTVDRNKTVASFCMGKKETYEFLHENPSIEFRTIDYTNNPLIIARQRHMTAINSGLEIDLTGQATADSIGSFFYSGIGGQADFMRGAVLAPEGKAILALPSTAEAGRISRIVPFLREGAGVTLTRGDIHYVVTEYGIAFLHGKNIRERAMDLIAIAHPEFRPWLLEEAKRLHLIYRDQAFIPGKRGVYPEGIEAQRTTKTGIHTLLRPVRVNDEPLLKDFFYSLSDASLYRRFVSIRKDMPHRRLQEFVVIDYSREMVILALVKEKGIEKIVGVGQYALDESSRMAEIAFVVRDEYQNSGVGGEMLSYLTCLAKRQGLFGFKAEVLVENKPMLRLFEKMGFEMEKKIEAGTYQLRMLFGQE